MTEPAQHTPEPAEAEDTATDASQPGDTEGVLDTEGAEPKGTDESLVEYWKRRARQHEERAKSSYEELEALRRESMSEQERAIDEARQGARNEAFREVSSRLVDAEVRQSSVNRPVNVDALLDGLDRTRFVTEDGEVDREAVSTWLDQLAPAQETPRVASDLGQGTRGVNRSTPDEQFGDLIARSLK